MIGDCCVAHILVIIILWTSVLHIYRYIFGAFTAAAWDSTNCWKEDPTAFIVSIVNSNASSLLIPVNAGDQYSIYCNVDYGPSFGRGHDIHISSNSNKIAASYSDLGNSFCCASFNAYLAGSRSFQTSDIEVFSISI